MSLVLIFIVLFFVLGVAMGPLLLGVATQAFSEPRGKRIGNWSFSIGLKSVWRPALTFNAADELVLKRRGYDEEHDEQKITFGGMFNKVERFLFDPQNRIHDFLGTPFCFVDERFGIAMDPRDAYLGRLLAENQEAGVYTKRVERGQQLVESVLGVFEVPKGNIGSRLPDVWTLIGGSFDAQLVRKIHEFYRKGQDPKSSTTAMRQFLLPVGTFIGILLLGMFAAGQTGGGGGGGGTVPENTRNIGEGLLLFWFTLSGPGLLSRIGDIFTKETTTESDAGFDFEDPPETPDPGDDDDDDGGDDTLASLRDLLVGAFFLGFSGLFVGGLYFIFPNWVSIIGIPLPLGIWGVVFMAIGLVWLPVSAAWFGRSLGPLGVLLGKLFLTIGLLPYSRPVISLVDRSTYELLEYEDGEWPVEPQWYRFALTRVGVGFTNGVDLWGEDVVETPARVESMGKLEADGGTAVEVSGASPPGYSVTSMIEQDGIYGFVPDDVDDESLYVRTDLTTGWFDEAGQNRRLMTAALETAKERFGGGKKPVDDKVILGATFAAMIMGAVFDWLVFF